MKKLVRILCLMLALIMLMSMFVACKKDNEKTDGGSDSVATGTDPVTPDNSQRFDENGYLMDDLPEDLDFDEKQISFLVWQEGDWDFWGADSLNLPTPIEREVYKRNLATEDRLNIKLNFVRTPGNNANMAKYLTEAETIHMSADGTMHGYACYSQVASSLMTRGMTVDLMSTKYFDAEKPWWAPQLLENGTTRGKLYYATGDIATSYFANGFVMYFNKYMANDYLKGALDNYGVSSLYELVDKGLWTIDVMMEFAKAVTIDDGDKGVDDQIGYVSHATTADGLYQAAGMKVLKTAADGSYVISEDCSSAKMHTYLEKLTTFMLSPAAGWGGDGKNLDYTVAFKGNRALFETREFYHAITRFKPIEGLNFGVLPLPKYDTEQESYYSTNSFTYTMYNLARCISPDDYDMVSAVMECLASEGYRRTATALYDTMLRTQTAHSVDDYEMWETIKNSIIVDAGRVHSTSIADMGWKIFRQPLMDACKGGGSVDYMSFYNKNKETFETKFRELNTTIVDLETLY